MRGKKLPLASFRFDSNSVSGELCFDSNDKGVVGEGGCEFCRGSEVEMQPAVRR